MRRAGAHDEAAAADGGLSAVRAAAPEIPETLGERLSEALR